MKTLSTLILLLASSVCSAAEVLMLWDAVATRTDGEVITGAVDYRIFKNGIEQPATTDLSYTIDAESADVLCVAAREAEGYTSEADCRTLPAMPNSPELRIQITFDL